MRKSTYDQFESHLNVLENALVVGISEDIVHRIWRYSKLEP